MLFNHKFVCILLLGLITFPINSLELKYRQDSNLLFEILSHDSQNICGLFTKKAQTDSIFSTLLSDCEKTGISKCRDTIFDWIKNKNIVEMDSVRLSKSIERFLKSNDILTEDEKNSLKNLSYLSSIYRSIEGYHGNVKLIRKLRTIDITPYWEKLKILKEQEVRHNRDFKYGICKTE